MKKIEIIDNMKFDNNGIILGKSLEFIKNCEIKTYQDSYDLLNVIKDYYWNYPEDNSLHSWNAKSNYLVLHLPINNSLNNKMILKSLLRNIYICSYLWYIDENISVFGIPKLNLEIETGRKIDTETESKQECEDLSYEMNKEEIEHLKAKIELTKANAELYRAQAREINGRVSSNLNDRQKDTEDII